MLGDNGLKVGIINVMVTYPPHPVNGFLLTGGLTPMGRSFAYPESLAKEITETFGDYRIWGVGGISLTKGGEEKFINAYFANERRRMDMAKYLMEICDILPLFQFSSNKQISDFRARIKGSYFIQSEIACKIAECEISTIPY